MFNNLKSKIIAICVALFLLGGFCFIIKSQHDKIRSLNNTVMVLENNNKAVAQENSNLKDKAIEFQYTIDQINHNNDSLVNRINEIRKQLKIKDKEITALQYVASETHKADSIIVRDTIFQKGVALDTLLEDKWSKLAIRAEYPNLLAVDYSFNNETVVLLHDSRVTVDPPKKCWLGRLFQKKQTIVEIDIVQENPYCTNKESKFIKIIK